MKVKHEPYSLERELRAREIRDANPPMRVHEDRVIKRVSGSVAQQKADLRAYCDHMKKLLDGDTDEKVPSEVAEYAHKLIKKFQFDSDFRDQMWYRGPT